MMPRAIAVYLLLLSAVRVISDFLFRIGIMIGVSLLAISIVLLFDIAESIMLAVVMLLAVRIIASPGTIAATVSTILRVRRLFMVSRLTVSMRRYSVAYIALSIAVAWSMVRILRFRVSKAMSKAFSISPGTIVCL